MNYTAALAWLYSLQRFGIKLGLENIRRLIVELQIALSGARVIHVAGTNGKGSVCAMIDSIGRAGNYRTGLFTSPHLVTFRERIRVSGEMISQGDVASGLTRIRELAATWDPHPTFFEVTTALALEYFAGANLDIVILETGLGGRLDATNAVQSNVAIITPIDLDHQQWLGNSLKAIAMEKAGIIKAGVPVISGPQHRDVATVIAARAAECQAPLQLVDRRYTKSAIALPGEHQRLNAAIATAALQLDGHSPSSSASTKTDGGRERGQTIKIEQAAVARGLATVEWPARFQKWDERTIIDGAHNPAAARALVETWRQVFGDQRATVVLAVLSDKDLDGVCKTLAPIAESIVLPKIRSERAVDPEQLAKVFQRIVPSRLNVGPAQTSISSGISEALKTAQRNPNPILITGSLHFAGEVLAYLRGEPAAFEECNQ
jgi:dihydrofolate synthase/folylpolyglutamate synthase